MSEEENRKKPFWLRWWFLTGVVLFWAGVIAVGVYVSGLQSGRERLQAFMDKMVADGRGAWPEDLYAGLEPRMSEELATEFDALATGEDLEALVAFVAAHGVPHSSYLRFMKQQPDTMRLQDLGLLTPTDDPPYATLADRLAVAAVEAEDPEPLLATLDRLLEGCTALPQGDMGALLRVMVMYRRDRAHLELAVAGRLADERARRWLAEDLDLPLDVMARGFRSQRLLMGGLYARQALGESGGNFVTELVYARMWPPADTVLYIERLAEAEETARKRGVPRTEDEFRTGAQPEGNFGKAMMTHSG
ncbi:MAG: hypothetical protein ACYTDX_08750, partial [Planctomycetota bacterium]